MDGLNEESDWNDEEVSAVQGNRLYLNNIPKELTTEGLNHMCSRYGNIVDVNRPPDKKYAFVEFELPVDAENMIRRFNDDVSLHISVEYARKREHISSSRFDYNMLDSEPLSQQNADEPLRNVLELSKRLIQGPFADPLELPAPDSVVVSKDYRNFLLRGIEPHVEYLWNSNDEVSFEHTFPNQKKIRHGRAIFYSESKLEKNVEPLKPLISEKVSFNSENEQIVFEMCASCGHPAEINCKTCNKPTCSIECHEICFHSDGNQLDEKPAIYPQKIAKLVKVTAVMNHRMVFVRPAEPHQNVAFARLLCDTVRYAKCAETLTTLPAVGSLVLAKFDYYQRGLVLKHLNDKMVAIAFIDFGNVETCDFRELKVMPTKLKHIKRFAIKIQLSNIEHEIMNSEQAILVLYRLMAYEQELNIDQIETIGNIKTAQLKASDKWVNELVNSKNVEGIKARPITSITDRIFYNKDFDSKQADCRQLQGKEVIILDNSQIELSDLAFISADDLKLFHENDQRIQNICNYLYTTNENYTPIIDECCLVKFNDRWYRAYNLETKADGFATMQFIDYGNMKIIEILDIRSIPAALIFPSLTIMANCFADIQDLNILSEARIQLKEQYPRWSRQKIERIEEQITENEFDPDQIEVNYMVWFEKKPQL